MANRSPLRADPGLSRPPAPQFMALHSMYIKSGDGFILVFSLTSMESVGELQTIREQIMRMKAGDGGRVRSAAPCALPCGDESLGPRADRLGSAGVCRERCHWCWLGTSVTCCRNGRCRATRRWACRARGTARLTTKPRPRGRSTSAFDFPLASALASPFDR